MQVNIVAILHWQVADSLWRFCVALYEVSYNPF